MYSYNPYYYEYLAHHGVKGQKWGIRRYQPYTSGQKGVFKNLKRSYKSSVRSLKKARKKYEESGNKLAVAAANKAIKDTKKSYKAEKKGLKKEFRAENWEKYKQDVVERGTEKEIKKVYKDLNTDQLELATKRLNKLQDYKKTSMRDVEAEVAQEKTMAKMDRIMKGADTVSKVALATTNVTSAYKNFKDLFKKPSAYEKEKQRLELEGMANNNDHTKAQTEKMRNETANKQPTTSNSTVTPKTSNSTVTPTTTQSVITKKSNVTITPKTYKDSNDPGFSSLSKAAQNGVKAYERAISAGKTEKAAENARRQAIIKSQTDVARVPVSEARKGTENSYRYILNNSKNYELKTVTEAEEWLKKNYGV